MTHCPFFQNRASENTGSLLFAHRDPTLTDPSFKRTQREIERLGYLADYQFHIYTSP